MTYTYDKDLIKNSLDISQIEEIVAELGGEPQIQGDVLVSRTICHGGSSRKLYYYSNSSLFHCFTDCSESFDIFELVRKVMSREHPKEREDPAWNLPEAIDYVARKFGFAPQENNEDSELAIGKDLILLNNYDRIKDIDINTQKVELKEYDGKFLKNLPHIKIESWIKDGITKNVMDYYEICYDPKNIGVVIPHKDINGRLVGIRERFLTEENIERYGKYRPAYFNRQLYTHPLSFNLYGLYQNKEHIKTMKKVFVFESEKAVLQYASMFGQENNLAVAVCGSSFINYQAWLLMNLGVEEIIIGLDKQFQDTGDAEFKKLVKNLKNIHKKYGRFIKISLLFDKSNLLGYKESPTDRDKETFLKLYKERINLYGEI